MGRLSTGNRLHIGAWVSPPPGYITDDMYRLVAESGINCIYGLYESYEEALEALKYADKYGLGYLVNHRQRNQGPGLKAKDLVENPQLLLQFADSPAFCGILTDEPGGNDFVELGELHREFKKLFPDQLFYVNLYPGGATLVQRHGWDYNSYINGFLDIVKPEILSYDLYPLWGDAVNEDFLVNAEIISKAAKARNIPFWGFIQSVGFQNPNRPVYYEGLRWQAYTLLAFGARGIQHFCYWTPEGNGTWENGGVASFDRQGNKTPIYDMVRRLNHELLRFDEVLLSYHPVGQMVYPVFADGKPPAFSEEGAKRWMFMAEPLTSFSPITKVEGDAVLVGCFEREAHEQAVMLVNMNDPKFPDKAMVILHTEGVETALVYREGVPSVLPVKNGRLTVELGPGEGQFVCFNKA